MLPEMTEIIPKSESLLKQTLSLAIILREEFGVAFAFYDAMTGDAIGERDPEVGKNPASDSARIKQWAAERQAQVALTTQGFELALPLGGHEVPILVAVGSIVGFARSKAEEIHEQARMQKWARLVCERINLTTSLPVKHRHGVEHEGSSKLAWEALVTLEKLTRRLRIHKDSAKHQKRILTAAAELLRVKAVFWVPQTTDKDVIVGGESLLSSFDVRQLAHRLYKSPDLEKSGVLLVNDLKGTSWGACFPQIHNLVALMVHDHGVSGLMIAMNKVQGNAKSQADQSTPAAMPLEGALRRGDALAFTTFAGLFGLHTGVSLKYHDLKELLVGMTRSLTSAIDAKDAYTFGHSERVGRIAIELGRALNLSDDELNDLYLGGLMHDIGKIGVRDSVLCKKGPLTPEEVDHLRQHVIIGHSIVADLHPIRHLFPAILYHHERVDGAGYPEGLKGDAIPLVARILAVADAYDAMTTTRPYRVAMTHERAGEILKEGAGTQWDKQVVDAFFRSREKIFIIRQRGVGESLRKAIDGALRVESSSLQSPPSLAAPML
ncbi:MAG: HD-GYP domain-containing protein [Planctomycetota bacterium]